MKRILMVLVFAGTLAACAAWEGVVTIPYAASDAGRVAGAGAVTLVVADERSMDRNRISTKIDAYGTNMGAVRSQLPVPDVVREALRVEFERRGYQVGTAGSVVTVSVKRFYNEYTNLPVRHSADGDVELSVSVSNASGAMVLDRSYKGVSSSMALFSNDSNAAESVASALRDAIVQMFADPDFTRSLTAG